MVDPLAQACLEASKEGKSFEDQSAERHSPNQSPGMPIISLYLGASQHR
jgi:hypothetical protein